MSAAVGFVSVLNIALIIALVVVGYLYYLEREKCPIKESPIDTLSKGFGGS